MTSATRCRTAFIVQGVTIDAIFMGPLFAKPFDFSDLIFMAYGAIADFFSLMTLVIKFHAMLEYENICCK